MQTDLEISNLIDRLIAREGGYIWHKDDPGGETKYGISKRSYPELEIKTLTRDDAKGIYRRDYYERFGLDRLDDIRTIEWILDWLVNSGPSVIGRIQQELKLEPDGVLGPKTAQAINRMKDPKDLLRWRLKFLVRLTRHPFITGWVNRLVELGL
jgi:lysozyme family protein